MENRSTVRAFIGHIKKYDADDRNDDSHKQQGVIAVIGFVKSEQHQSGKDNEKTEKLVFDQFIPVAHDVLL